jgi:hypothetical protein
MVELSLCVDKDTAFNLCWNSFLDSQEGIDFLNELKEFLIRMCKKYSPDL